jgi:hypothetical protein
VPLVIPVKYAEAIEQKNMFEAGTAVKGIVILAPPQVPVSARIAVDTAVIINILLQAILLDNRSFG